MKLGWKDFYMRSSQFAVNPGREHYRLVCSQSICKQAVRVEDIRSLLPLIRRIRFSDNQKVNDVPRSWGGQEILKLPLRRSGHNHHSALDLWTNNISGAHDIGQKENVAAALCSAWTQQFWVHQGVIFVDLTVDKGEGEDLKELLQNNEIRVLDNGVVEEDGDTGVKVADDDFPQQTN